MTAPQPEPVGMDHPDIQAHLKAQEGVAPGYVRLSSGEIVRVGSHRTTADNEPDA